MTEAMLRGTRALVMATTRTKLAEGFFKCAL